MAEAGSDAAMTPSAGISVRGTTRVVGVFGYPVRHSASPPMHNAAFAALGLDWVYVPFTVAPEHLGAALNGIRALGMAGANLTVPLKEAALPFLDTISPRARAIRAVNTVVVTSDGALHGDSTDGPGFLRALSHADIALPVGARVVVLGAGGSARAVVYALAEAGAAVVVANRDVARAEALAAEFNTLPGLITAIPLTADALKVALTDAELLVNTTSVGMHPDIEAMPLVPADALHAGIFVSDLIYNPRETRLLTLARSRGCRVQNGIEMLVQQGALAFSQWTGVAAPPLNAMRTAVYQALNVPQAG